jgi:hypothetical protein
MRRVVASSLWVGIIFFLYGCGSSTQSGLSGPSSIQSSQIQGKWKLKASASRLAWSGFMIQGDQFHSEDGRGGYQCPQTIFIDGRTLKLGSNSTRGCALLATSMEVTSLSDTEFEWVVGSDKMTYFKIP